MRRPFSPLQDRKTGNGSQEHQYAAPRPPFTVVLYSEQPEPKLRSQADGQMREADKPKL